MQRIQNQNTIKRLPRQVLQEQSKKLRRSIYEIDETMKEKFPDKNTEDSLEKELKYCKQLIDVVKGNEEICSYPKVQEKLNLLEESVTDDMEHLETSKDEDAKTGHKTADTSFFGYKTHIAMTEERIITAATITSGEKTDGKELPKLVQKSKAAGIQIESVIGDMAYSEKKNIEAAKKGDYELIAKLNPIITQGNRRKEDEFEFNKDAGLFVCPEGHMAVRKARTGKKYQNKNQVVTHYFDIEKCKSCLSKEGCYKEGAKSKTYSITIKSNDHLFQKKFQETPYFREMARHRYKIEAKNAELKQRHGFDVARASGLFNMELQAATTIFVVNMKRIMTLI